jgi:hypothetical protein
MTAALRWLLAIAVAFAASHAGASFHTFVINEVFSNADGTVQYVELREAFGFGSQNLFIPHALTSTSTHTGAKKTFPFPNNIPSNTALKKVLIATQGFADLGLVTPDYIMPNGFLATDGATVDYAEGVSQMSYGDLPLTPLPTDGVTALTASGTAVNAPTNFAGATTTLPALPVTAVEFYRQAVDHYFISALQPDIDALDSGRLAGWVRTGFSFKVFPTQAAGGAGANPVCRFYIPPQHGDSHFFSADPVVECPAILAKIQSDPNYSGYDYETPNAFYIALPNTTTGACPTGTIPVYRLWNQRADSNHRYTTDPAIKAQMIAKGYVAEGYGPDSVIMCAPA